MMASSVSIAGTLGSHNLLNYHFLSSHGRLQPEKPQWGVAQMDMKEASTLRQQNAVQHSKLPLCVGNHYEALGDVTEVKAQQLRKPEIRRQDFDEAERDAMNANGAGSHVVETQESVRSQWEVDYNYAHGDYQNGIHLSGHAKTPGWSSSRQTDILNGNLQQRHAINGHANNVGMASAGNHAEFISAGSMAVNPRGLQERNVAGAWSPGLRPAGIATEHVRRAEVRGLYVPRNTGNELQEGGTWKRKKEQRAGHGKWRPGSYPVRVKNCVQLINLLPLSCKLEVALVSWEERLTVMEMNTVLKQIRSWQRAAEFVDWMADVAAPDVYSYTILIRSLVLARQWRAIDKLVAEVEREGTVELDNIAFCTIIAGAGKAGQLDEAVKWFQRMKDMGCDPDAVTYNAVIDAYGRAGKYSEALRIVEGMEDAGFKPDRVTFSSLLSACRCLGSRDEAVSIFQRMQDAGHKVDVVAYSSMLDIYGKAGEPDEALKLFERMKSEGVAQDTTCWNCLFHAMGKADRVDDAYALFAEMRESGCAPDQVTYATLIWMFSKAGMHDRALAILRMMETEGFKPDEYCYTALLSHYASAKQWKRAEALFQEMKQKSCPYGIVTYSAMINVLSKSGKVTEAETVFTEMKLSGCQPNTVVYSCLLDMYGKLRNVNRALAIFREMLSAGCEPNVYTYNILIDIFGKNGFIEQAESAFQEMRLAGLQADQVTYSAMINARGKAELYPEAIQLFEEMRGSRCQPDVVLFGTMIKVYARSGLYKDSIRVFEEMVGKGVEVDDVMYTSMLEMYWKADRKEEARALWEKMQSLGICLVNRRPHSSGIVTGGSRAESKQRRQRQKGKAGKESTESAEVGMLSSDLVAERDSSSCCSDGLLAVEAGTGEKGQTERRTAERKVFGAIDDSLVTISRKVEVARMGDQQGGSVSGLWIAIGGEVRVPGGVEGDRDENIDEKEGTCSKGLESGVGDNQGGGELPPIDSTVEAQRGVEMVVGTWCRRGKKGPTGGQPRPRFNYSGQIAPGVC